MGIRNTVKRAYSAWMDAGGLDGDIAVSSRIRIARNLQGHPFPHLLDRERAGEIINIMQPVLEGESMRELAGKFEVTRMAELSPVERQILVEKHLISPDLLKNHSAKAVALRDDEVISVMINEEDHLRIQCLLPGLQLKEAWSLVDRVDDGLEKTIEYAFSEQYGYLTACPTNAGTGLRASVMLHLPGLVLLDQVRGIFANISKLGFAVRGLYGEGTEALGNLFQISNQVTMGHTEEDIINSLGSVAGQLILQEREARKLLLRERLEQLQDRVGRSYGILKHARIISSEESMRRLSDLKMGIDLGLTEGADPGRLIELMIMTRPAFLLQEQPGEISPQQRDVLRAALIRKSLNQEADKR